MIYCDTGGIVSPLVITLTNTDLSSTEFCVIDLQQFYRNISNLSPGL